MLWINYRNLPLLFFVIFFHAPLIISVYESLSVELNQLHHIIFWRWQWYCRCCDQECAAFPSIAAIHSCKHLAFTWALSRSNLVGCACSSLWIQERELVFSLSPCSRLSNSKCPILVFEFSSCNSASHGRALLSNSNDQFNVALFTTLSSNANYSGWPLKYSPFSRTKSSVRRCPFLSWPVAAELPRWTLDTTPRLDSSLTLNLIVLQWQTSFFRTISAAHSQPSSHCLSSALSISSILLSFRSPRSFQGWVAFW